MNHPICPNCQSPIPPDAPGGLCPSCVLLAAASTGSLPPGIAAAPDLDTVRAAFPELEVIELIGHGGMGVVFKARQPRLDRLVALKILPPVLATQPGFAERFTREARALGRLSHPNIVAVYDFGQRAGIFYLMMEFVNGVNLRQAMRTGVKPEQALILVPRICEALQFAHDHGVLHRDIKPENILLDTTGTPKLADFGIAKLAGEAGPQTGLTQTGAALGTAAYMAPEQIEKPATVDHRADIYSLGVVLYEMLTGELPLGRFAAPSEKAHVARGVDDVVLRALEKERERRQQSATEMKTEVEHARTNPGTGAHAPAGHAPPGRGGGSGPSGAWNPGQAPHSGQPSIAPGPGDFGWYLGRFFIGLTALSGAMIPLAGGSRAVGDIVSPATLALLCPVFGAMIAVSHLLFGGRRPGSIPVATASGSRGLGKRIFMSVAGSLLLAFVILKALSIISQRQRQYPHPFPDKPPVSIVLPAGGNAIGRVGGGTIELVALAPSPSQGERWSRMDGSFAGNTFVVDRRDLKVKADQRAYDFVFRRVGLPAGTSFEGYRVRGSTEQSSGSLVELASSPGRKLPSHEALSTVLPADARTANVRVAVAFDEWTTISETGAQNSISNSTDYGGVRWNFSHDSAYETNAGETIVTYVCLTPRDWEIRVIGVMGDGREIPHLRLSRIDNQRQWTFPTPKDGTKIALFRLQVRPIEYVEFRDIVLPPVRSADSPSLNPNASASPSDTASVKALTFKELDAVMAEDRIIPASAKISYDSDGTPTFHGTVLPTKDAPIAEGQPFEISLNPHYDRPLLAKIAAQYSLSLRTDAGPSPTSPAPTKLATPGQSETSPAAVPSAPDHIPETNSFIDLEKVVRTLHDAEAETEQLLQTGVGQKHPRVQALCAQMEFYREQLAGEKAPIPPAELAKTFKINVPDASLPTSSIGRPQLRVVFWAHLEPDEELSFQCQGVGEPWVTVDSTTDGSWYTATWELPTWLDEHARQTMLQNLLSVKGRPQTADGAFLLVHEQPHEVYRAPISIRPVARKLRSEAALRAEQDAKIAWLQKQQAILKTMSPQPVLTARLACDLAIAEARGDRLGILQAKVAFQQVLVKTVPAWAAASQPPPARVAEEEKERKTLQAELELARRQPAPSADWQTIFQTDDYLQEHTENVRYGGLLWRVSQSWRESLIEGKGVGFLLTYEVPAGWEARLVGRLPDGTLRTDGVVTAQDGKWHWAFAFRNQEEEESAPVIGTRLQVRPKSAAPSDAPKLADHLGFTLRIATINTARSGRPSLVVVFVSPLGADEEMTFTLSGLTASSTNIQRAAGAPMYTVTWRLPAWLSPDAQNELLQKLLALKDQEHAADGKFALLDEPANGVFREPLRLVPLAQKRPTSAEAKAELDARIADLEKKYAATMNLRSTPLDRALPMRDLTIAEAHGDAAKILQARIAYQETLLKTLRTTPEIEQNTPGRTAEEEKELKVLQAEYEEAKAHPGNQVSAEAATPPAAPASAKPSNDATSQRLDALYDENIRLAKTNLEQAQARHQAGVASMEELEIAEQELAVAEARGDALRANQARLILVEKQLKRTTAQVEAGVSSTEELRALQVKKTTLQIEITKAVASAPTSAPDKAKLDAIYEEAIQLARQNLDMTRKRFEAGLCAALDVTKAERDVAVAEARGDTLRIAKARLAYANQALELVRHRVESGLASTEELHAVQNDKIEAEIEIAKSGAQPANNPAGQAPVKQP